MRVRSGVAHAAERLVDGSRLDVLQWSWWTLLLALSCLLVAALLTAVVLALGPLSLLTTMPSILRLAVIAVVAIVFLALSVELSLRFIVMVKAIRLASTLPGPRPGVERRWQRICR
jgi:hypothetical protein